MAQITGRIQDHNEVVKDKKIIYIIPDTDEANLKVAIPLDRRMRVHDGDIVQAGDQLDEGSFMIYYKFKA